MRRLLAQVGLISIQQVQPAPSEDLIGSLFRAKVECTQTDSCPENLPDPIQPSLAATLRALRGGLAGLVDTVDDLLGRRKLRCTSFTNPVINSDFADPSQPIVGENGLLYAYSTNSMGFNIQVTDSIICSCSICSSSRLLHNPRALSSAAQL